MRNNKYILFLLLLLPFFGFSQIKTTKLKETDIPKNISYKGKIVNAVRYTDANGDTIVITTETGTYTNIEDPESGSDSELYAYSYTLENGVWQLKWKVYDFIKECPVDIQANYVKDTFAVTDLNKDNKAEVWLMYTTVCHGDVSPSNMKIIMYENGKKHAMRGENKVQVGNNEYMGGEYTFDNIFKQSPKEFRDYAAKLWNKHITGN
ncbi:MAG: hypothetical protein DI539_03325 [Flavobacterium psychrophilum]|nr:MAG: hypothetical protein DI539_03325 [Flavobacterium psychrophilum]